MNALVFCLLFLSSLFSFSSFSQDVENVEIEITTEEVNRNLITERAVNEVSIDFVKNFIGERKFKKYKDKIEKDIIENKNRYIIFTKLGPSEIQEDEQYLTKVSIGLSKKNLQAVLVEHNLYYSSQGAACVLPLVVFEDQAEQTKSNYVWWKQKVNQEKPNASLRLARNFYSSFHQKLIEGGFYGIDPVFSRSYESIPKVFLPKGNRTKDFMNLSNFLVCDIVLSGKVKVSEHEKETSSYPAEFSFTVFNIKTKQKLFAFSKKIKLVTSKEQSLEDNFKMKLPNMLNSILFQLSFYKEKGALDLNRMMISIQGPLDYHQKEKLKNEMLRNISSIKGLQERFLASNKIVYEAEIESNIHGIVKELKNNNKSKFSIEITDYNSNQLNIYAKEKKK